MAITLENQEKLFNMFIIFTYIFYGSAIVGVSLIDPKLFTSVDYYVKLYVAGFLVYRYNPLVTGPHKYTSLDRKVCFHAGVFLLFTLLIKSVLVRVLGSDPEWLSGSGLCVDKSQSMSDTTE